MYSESLNMLNTVKKTRRSLQRQGILKTIWKAICYPLSALKRRRFAKAVLALESNEARFTWIYKNNYWQSDESVSGTGSSLKNTENLREELPALISKFSVKKIFDAPCGDFNWMSHLLPLINVEYIGGDIVRPLIKSHNHKFKSSKISFITIDLIKDNFPESDLMICRDCLFHLSFADARSLLQKFVASGILYFLTTTHKQIGDFENYDIRTGDFRLIDLFAAPYHFPSKPLAVIDDWAFPDPERQMCLWTREQVMDALARFDQI
jgi:hypothetical protein